MIRKLAFLSLFICNIAIGQTVTSSPTVSTLTTGTVLDAKAAVSSDRRYITMDINVSNSTLARIDRYNISGQLMPTSGRTENPDIINLENVPLDKAINYLRQQSQANIIVNWKTLEAVGVSKDTLITLTLNNVSFNKILQLMLEQASPNAKLVWSWDSNVLTITTQEEADKNMVTRVYIVDDLVMVDTKASTPPSMDLGKVTSGSTVEGSSNGSSVGSLFGTSPTTPAVEESTPQKRGEELVKLITEIVRPNIWKENGGNASIRYFSGKLIVTAPMDVQLAIGGSRYLR